MEIQILVSVATLVRNKLRRKDRIPKYMTSRAMLLFIFVDRKTIQSKQNDVMFLGIWSFLLSLVRDVRIKVLQRVLPITPFN